MIPDAVIFDLDDTLVDHSYASRMALYVISKENAAFADAGLDRLVQLWGMSIDTYWPRVIRGEISLLQNRIIRIGNMAKELGHNIRDDEILRIAQIYSREYMKRCAPIEGSMEILRKIRDEGIRTGIITNNISEMKYEKVDRLGFSPYLDSVTLSAEYGIMKPRPEIFHIALNRLKTSPGRSVMIGDSLENDVSGAIGAGMKAIWFNRGSMESSVANTGIISINSYVPPEEAWNIIISAFE